MDKHITQQIERIKDLEKEIKGLEYFLNTVTDPIKVPKSGHDFEMLIKNKTKKHIQYLGRDILVLDVMNKK